MAEETVLDRDAIFQRLRDLTESRKLLVPSWVEHQSDSGETYFYNAETQASVWEKPVELQTPGEIVLSESTWKEYKSPDGKVYFHDLVSGQTRWDPPQSLLDLKAWIAEFAASSVNGMKVEPSGNQRAASEEASGGVESVGASSTPSRSPAGSHRSRSVRPEEAARDETPLPEVPEEKTLDVFSVGDINSVEKKEATEAFRRFLDEKNVPSNINWENCVKIIQSDKRFEVWKKFSDRKQAFNQYKIQKQKQEKEDQRKRQEKARETFEKMLLSTDKVSYSTPYRDADRVFATDKIWRGVAERERESLYEDVMAVVEKREKEQAERDREESMEKLGEILNNMGGGGGGGSGGGTGGVTFRTTWAECQKALAECSAFMNDPVVKKINKLDALRVFMEHIVRLEKEHEEEVRAERRQRKRAHRKYREAYQVLLDELCRQGIITSMAKWKSVFPIIRNDSRFLNMQEQYGSNALDLFKLHVKDLQNRYTADLDVVLAILKDQHFTVTSTTEFSDFLRVMHKDDRCLPLDRGNVKMAFESLSATAIQEDKGREEEVRKGLEREVRQKEAVEEAFKEMLRESKMTFASTDKWLSVHEIFANKQACLAVRDEEDRIRLFHEYVAKGQLGEGKEKGRKKSKKEKERREKEGEDSVHKRKRQTSPDEEDDGRRDREKDVSQRRKRQASPVEMEEERGSRSQKKRLPSPVEEDSDARSPRKKKRHHRSPEVPLKEKERSKKDESRRDDHSRRDEKERGKKRPDTVVEAKAEKMAKELSEDELEQQRKQLMKQLGLM